MYGFHVGGAGQITDAIAIWQNVKRQAPYTVGVDAQLCLGYLILKQFDNARRACDEELSQRPHSAVARLHLAMMLDKEGRVVEAINELRTAVKLDPQYKKAQDMLTRLQP